MENNNQVKNSGKGKNIVIVFLILIILGLCGFIVYDKYVKDDVVNELLNNNRTGNFIFAKFVTEVDDTSTLINMEVFKTVMQVIA